MRVHLIGGFLGAGKTTLVRAAAGKLAGMGERVAIVTNDQGASLVDTTLCSDSTAIVSEVPGGCFCCRYSALEEALAAAERDGATVTFAEAVGSCTDLVATVLSPLARRATHGLDVAPLTVVVDPARVLEAESQLMRGDVAYLFRKQIEEADVVLLTRADLAPPDVTDAVRAINPRAQILSVSGPCGTGVEAWLAMSPTDLSAPLAIDYARYARAEALLGWANAVVVVESEAEDIDPASVIEAFLNGMSSEPVAHVKVVTTAPAGCHGSLVRQGDHPLLSTSALPARVARLEMTVNARVALTPDRLSESLRGALSRAVGDAVVTWHEMECFQPSAPEPTHRDVERCHTGDNGSCCASFYQNDAVRLLLGDSFHPGGVALTMQVSESLMLAPGHRVLDIACGEGTSLRALAGRWGITPVGLDAGGGADAGIDAAGVSRPAEVEIRRGDAHDVPFDDASFDAVLCECALSTFRDKRQALSEMARVLRPGGRLGLTDMVVEGAVPPSLAEWVHLGTCIPGALRLDEYASMIEASGLRIVESRDAPEALRELLRRLKRNLVGLALAQAAGGVAGPKIDGKLARDLAREASAAIDAGVLGYGVFVAEKPA